MYNVIVYRGSDSHTYPVVFTQMEWHKTKEEARAAFENAKDRARMLRAVLFGERIVTGDSFDTGNTEQGPVVDVWSTSDPALIAAYPNGSELLHVE